MGQVQQAQRSALKVAALTVALWTASCVLGGCASAPQHRTSVSGRAAQEPTTSQRFGLGCEPPTYSIDAIAGGTASDTPDGPAETTVSAGVGEQLQFTVSVANLPWIYLESYRIAIVSGSDSAKAPNGAAGEQSSWDAWSAAITDQAASGQSVTVSWTPQETGDYSLFVLEDYDYDSTCSDPPFGGGDDIAQQTGQGILASIDVAD